MRTLRSTASIALAALLITFACGCSGPEEDRPELTPATGSLTVNGKPAEGALVILHPQDGQDFDVRGTRPRGTVGADGKFEVTTYQSGDGAPAGTYRVAVTWPSDLDAGSAWDRLGGRYANAQQSEITVTVGDAGGDLGSDTAATLPPIELDRVRLIARPPARKSNNPDGLD